MNMILIPKHKSKVTATIIASSIVFISFLQLPYINAMAQMPVPTTTNNLNYENPTHGIRLQYPSDWIASSNALPSYNGIIAFYSPLENLTDILPVELALSISTYTNNISMQEYTDLTINALEQQGFLVTDPVETALAGNPAYRITFSPTEQTNIPNAPIDFEVMQLWSAIGNKLYLFSYSGEESKFQRYLPEVEQILSSFQLS